MIISHVNIISCIFHALRPGIVWQTVIHYSVSDKDVVGSCDHFPGIVYSHIMYGLPLMIILCTHHYRYTVVASVKPTYYADCIENSCEVIQTQLQ